MNVGAGGIAGIRRGGARRGRGRGRTSKADVDTFGQQCLCSYNEFIVAGLQKLVEAASQKGTISSNILSTYRKAIQSIQKSPLPIKSMDDIKKLKYVGVSLSVEIQKILRIQDLGQISNSELKLDSDHLENATDKASNDSEPAPRAKKRHVAPSKEYIPRFMSGAYAILVAMAHENHTFRKTELIRAAQPYSETSFTSVDVSGGGSHLYNAWNSMGTLVNKDLVIKSGTPARYDLTPTGRILGQRLLEEWTRQDNEIELSEAARAPHEPAAASSPISCLVERSIAPDSHSRSQIDLPPSEYDIVLVVDSAETYRDSRDKVLNEFHRRELLAERSRLAIGDYCWVARRKGSHGLAGTVLLPMIVERKKDADLADSIKDSRYEEQKFRLLRTGMQIVYLLEGDPNSSKSIDPKSITSAISRMTAHDGFFVYHTQDIDNSVRFLSAIQKEFLSKVARSGLPAQVEPFFAFNDRMDKSALPDKSHQFGNMLMALTGISSYRCEAIIKTYPTLPSLLEAYKNCSSLHEEESLLASMEFLSKGISKAKIGIALSKKIRSFFREKSYVSKSRE